MVAFDALLKMLGDIMHRIWVEQSLFDGRFDGRRKGIGAVGADLAG
jgi:hypothetical protein